MITSIPQKRCDMHVHLRPIEKTFDGISEHRHVEPGKLYKRLCMEVINRMVYPMSAETFGLTLTEIKKLYALLLHDIFFMYNLAKKRSMDYFAATDHDTIMPVMEFLEQYPECESTTIVGIEITSHFLDGIYLHVGAYGLNMGNNDAWRLYKYIEEAKGDLVNELIPCLKELNLLHGLMHGFQVPTSIHGNKLTIDHMKQLREIFSVVEGRNGLLPQNLNEKSIQFFKNKAFIGGTDSHRLSGIGTTWTSAPGNSKEEFLQAISDHKSSVHGKHGSIWRFMHEIVDKVFSYGTAVRFALPANISSKDRKLIESKLIESGQKLLKSNGDTIVSMPFNGKWIYPVKLLEIFSILISPIYATALLNKEPWIEESLLRN